MPHIPLPDGLPGIRGPMAFRPETAKPLNELANILLHGPHSLTPGERELIATYVSSRERLPVLPDRARRFAALYLGGDEALVQQVKTDPERAAMSPQAEGAPEHRRQDRRERQAGDRRGRRARPRRKARPTSRSTTRS